MDQSDLSAQTDEALGWAAEGKKLAVDVPNKDVTLKDAATFVASMTPIIGDAMSAKEIWDETQKEDPNWLLVGALGGATAIGLIPGVGDAAASLIKKGARNALDTAKRVEVDPTALGSGLGNLRLKPKADEILNDAPTDAVDDLGFTPEDLSSWKDVNYAKDKFRVPPQDEMAAAATELREGTLSPQEFKKLSDLKQPVVPIVQMPKFPTKEEVVQALHATDPRKTKKGVIGINKTIEDGTPISARLDIPAYNNTDTWVVSLHDGTTAQGKSVGYGQTAVLDDVSFTSNPLAASNIATGKPKATIARMQGSWQNMEPEQVYRKAEKLFDDPEWSQVGMNPYRASYFYDKADGMPVVAADQVIQVGPLVFAKRAVKTTPDDPRFEFEIKSTGVKSSFNEGGLAMDDQMDAMFKSSRTDEVDPVSGNEVPTGSLPEEVRDDIPAQLSEGEYVVPADVVRYFGVKFFEDIRTQAKQGFQELEQGGRIGGDPVGMEMGDDELPFDISELQMVDDGEPEQPMMNKGGYVSGYNEGGGVTQMKEPDFIKNSGYDFGSLSGTELIENRTYVNEAGLTMVIRFVDGVPDVPIPAGYTLQGSAVEEAAPTTETSSNDNDRTSAEEAPPSERKDWSAASVEDYDEVMKRRDSLLGKAGPGALGLVSPILGLAAKAITNANSRSMIAGLDDKLKNKDLVGADRDKLQGYYDTLIQEQNKRNEDTKLGIVEGSGIFGGQSTMYENLKDTSGDGKVSFGDTWLGDTLGFDGKFGTDKAGLGASIGGARRNGGGSSSESTPTPTASSGGKNSFFQNVANTFTPKDGKSYVDGKLKDDD
jgi:hypothetical protein